MKKPVLSDFAARVTWVAVGGLVGREAAKDGMHFSGPFLAVCGACLLALVGAHGLQVYEWRREQRRHEGEDVVICSRCGGSFPRNSMDKRLVANLSTGSSCAEFFCPRNCADRAP